MGTYSGESGRIRVGIWTEINRAFSPFNIDATQAAYAEYKEEKGDKAHFIDFVVAYGLVPKEHVEQWKTGANVFAPGTFDIVNEAVDRNLTTRYSRFKGGPAVPQGKRALPMLFERSFGDSESVSVKPTRHGMKISIVSIMAPTNNTYVRSEPGIMAASWGRGEKKPPTPKRPTPKRPTKKRRRS